MDVLLSTAGPPHGHQRAYKPTDEASICTFNPINWRSLFCSLTARHRPRLVFNSDGLVFKGSTSWPLPWGLQRRRLFASWASPPQSREGRCRRRQQHRQARDRARVHLELSGGSDVGVAIRRVARPTMVGSSFRQHTPSVGRKREGMSEREDLGAARVRAGRQWWPGLQEWFTREFSRAAVAFGFTRAYIEAPWEGLSRPQWLRPVASVYAWETCRRRAIFARSGDANVFVGLCIESKHCFMISFKRY